MAESFKPLLDWPTYEAIRKSLGFPPAVSEDERRRRIKRASKPRRLKK